MSSGAWYRKYSPVTLSEVILPENAPKNKIQSFYDNSFIDGNLLCQGPTGTGKTTLNEVLISKVIKHSNNLIKVGRKIEDIDDVANQLRYQVYYGGKQRVVMIEEMDKLNTYAQTALKVELMEKYQHNTTFLATTNKPEDIDPALLSRFNTNIDFGENPNIDEVFNRFKVILHAEGVVFKEEELRVFVETNIDIGIRNMINDMELASDSGTFKPVYKYTKVTPPVINTKVNRKDIVCETKRIWNIYGHSMLSKEEVADELNISTKTLDRRIKEKCGIPSYKKEGKSHIGFPVREIAIYLVEGLVKTA